MGTPKSWQRLLGDAVGPGVNIPGRMPPEIPRDIRVGVIESDANPPTMVELLVATKAMAEFKIDKILYAVPDGKHKDHELLQTKQHRWAMARLAVALFDPLIALTDFGNMSGKPIDKTIMHNGTPRYRVDVEDYAFEIFLRNPRERITLFILIPGSHCRRVDTRGRDDTLNKLTANVNAGLYGFDPLLHKVVALFVGRREQARIDFDRDAQVLLEQGILKLEWLDPGKAPASLENASEVARGALAGKQPELLPLVPHNVYEYIQQHPDCRDAMLRYRPVPFKMFDGFLKQMVLDRLSPEERTLFDTLFPRFYIESGNREAAARAQNDPLYKRLNPRIRILAADERARRFAGYDFPRNRYYTLANDALGTDNQTLAHELRAYRDPVNIGMVEVIDLTNGCVLSIQGKQISIPPEQAMGVLIHPYRELPSRFAALSLQTLPGLKGPSSYLFRLPYIVVKKIIDRVIDLRDPSVRDWFHDKFKIPSEAGHAMPGPLIDPIIAHSQFHLENGTPPVPQNFWQMLPTLINPDLGGGSPSTTGSTLFFIGHWMRSADVAALIYPSARCDSAVAYHHGKLQTFHGWNFVDFENSPIWAGPGTADVVTHDPSPWAWVNFPRAVVLHAPGSDSEFAGSFAIDGMVNYWASTYLRQIKALETVRSACGEEGDLSQPSAAMALRIWHLGTLLFRWLRMCLDNAETAAIERSVLMLLGLAIPCNFYQLTGHIDEDWADLREGKSDLAGCLSAALRVGASVKTALSRKYPNSDLDTLLQTAADIEWMLVTAAMKVRAKPPADFLLTAAFSEFEKEIRSQRSGRWLTPDLSNRLRRFMLEFPGVLTKHSADPRTLIRQGELLQNDSVAHLKREAKDMSRAERA